MSRRSLVAWSAVAVAGLAVVVVTALVWALGRPAEFSGESLSDIRSSTPTPAPAMSTSQTPATTPERPVPGGDTMTAVPRPAARPADPEAVAAAMTPAPVPTRVEVESLDIDAVVDAVGVEPDGSMTIPRSASRVGWYSYGPAPGDSLGNTVLAGHVDTAADGPGALFRLREADVGTRIVVTDAVGTRREYEVAGKESVVKAALPVADIFARDGRSLLVMVTCGGDFQPELRSYTNNLVVTAVPVAGGA